MRRQMKYYAETCTGYTPNNNKKYPVSVGLKMRRRIYLFIYF